MPARRTATRRPATAKSPPRPAVPKQPFDIDEVFVRLRAATRDPRGRRHRRITNRWGYVSAPTPEATLAALEAKLPTQYHVEMNERLVPFGKQMCTGRAPRYRDSIRSPPRARRIRPRSTPRRP